MVGVYDVPFTRTGVIKFGVAGGVMHLDVEPHRARYSQPLERRRACGHRAAGSKQGGDSRGADKNCGHGRYAAESCLREQAVELVPF